jgi:hypothetical protein
MPSAADKPSPTPHADEPIILQASTERTPKSYGEAAEAALLARACRLGFSVAKPWGDSDRFDLLIDAGQGFWRVQVKSSQRYADGRFRVKNGGSQGVPYTPEEIDFIAAYIVPLDLWYIVPIDAAGSSKSLRFYPCGSGKARFERYLEAWCLLASKPTARGWKDIPTICRAKYLPVRCTVCPLIK